MFKTLLIAIAKWAAIGYCLDATWTLLQDVNKNSPVESVCNKCGFYFKK